MNAPSAHAVATAASKRRRSSTWLTTAAASRASRARPCSSTTRCRASGSSGPRIKRGRNFDEGRLLRVLEPRADRVEPRCAHFGVCGGCVLQHLAPPRQLEFKQRQLFEALTRIGKVTPAEMLPPLQGGVWNYRRRARLAARWVPKKERTVLGFRERSTSFIADVKRCEVLLAPVDALVEPLSLLLTALSVRNRVPQIEVAIADNAVALVVRVLEELTPQDRELLLQFAREHAVQIYLQPGGYETIAPLTDGHAARIPAAAVRRHGAISAERLHPGQRRAQRSDGRARGRAAGAGARRAGARPVLRPGQFLAAARAQRRARRRRRGRCRTRGARPGKRRAQRHRRTSSSCAAISRSRR